MIWSIRLEILQDSMCFTLQRHLAGVIPNIHCYTPFSLPNITAIELQLELIKGERAQTFSSLEEKVASGHVYSHSEIGFPSVTLTLKSSFSPPPTHPQKETGKANKGKYGTGGKKT